MNLTFNDVVRTDTFDASGLIIQDAVNSAPTRRFSLTRSSTTISPSGYAVMVEMSDQDRFDMQLYSGWPPTSTQPS